MDRIYYRFPAQTEQFEKFGHFEVIQSQTIGTGFILSDFLHQRIFQFKETEVPVGNLIWHQDDSTPLVISPRDYQIEAQGMLHAFDVMGVKKAVYSRVKLEPFETNRAKLLFDELCRSYPNAFCYLVSSKQFGTWVGATPELLLKKEGLQIKTVALASTHKVDEEKTWNEKELDEHEFVVAAIAETLERNNCFSIEKDGPKEHIAGPVKHLKTDFSAILTQPNTWEIAMDLHPTPAVCGTPRMQALDLLVSREMHSRELYTGIIGWNSEENTQLFVNLRCAKLQDNKAYLFVGGGYTIDSIPDLEWEETENKAQTLIQAMKKITNA